MTRVPDLSPTPEHDGKQVDAAISQLICLIARQAARELGSGASDKEETHQDAAHQPEKS